MEEALPARSRSTPAVDMALRKGSGDGYPPVMLTFHPSMRKLAKNIADATTARANKLSLQSTSQQYRQVQVYDCVRWDRFRDGWPNIFINNVEDVAGKDVILLASFHSPEVIFEQLSLIYQLPRYLVRSFRLIMPYFPTATMERVDKEGQIVTAKSLATMLSIIPFAARGPTQIFVFDIHALQERFYFSDQVIPRLLSATPLLLREIQSLPDHPAVSIAFPDEGAFKRFHSDFHHYPTITCIKVRDRENRIVRIKDGDPKDRHVVIVDDLVQTGGTLIECAKVLKAREAKAISVFVTHAVFPQDSWRRFIGGEVEFDNFWITDSIPHALTITEHPPFKLLSLCDVIADSLLGYDLLSQNQ